MGETRVDLQHLLEDLRDAYTGALEETILTEVVANALDSGATRIRLLTNPADATLTIVDDGRGMQRRELARYHDVAASTKARGRGNRICRRGHQARAARVARGGHRNQARRHARRHAVASGLTSSRALEMDSAAGPDDVSRHGGATDLDESVVTVARRRLSRRDAPATFRAAARSRVRRPAAAALPRRHRVRS